MILCHCDSLFLVLEFLHMFCLSERIYRWVGVQWGELQCKAVIWIVFDAEAI